MTDPKRTGLSGMDAKTQRTRFGEFQTDFGDATGAVTGPTIPRRIGPRPRSRIPERRTSTSIFGSEVEQISADGDLTINFNIDGKLVDTAKISKRDKSENVIKKIDPDG